ncbi:MAG: nuclease-related domain-containing protein [Clostridium sp.]|uniref:nuclease-related domain-containing protein n=1 Tax=Clostridium sp. TaxID=1506 RepID=UPI002FC9B2BC
MAILVKMDEVKSLNKEKEKFKLDKISAVIAFIISIFIVKLVLVIFSVGSLFGNFEDLFIIVAGLILTYAYLKRKYLRKEHTDKGFIKLVKDSEANIHNSIIPEELCILNDSNYILKNLSFKSPSGINYIHTAVINKDALFIIYIRNDRGEVSGSANDNKWTVDFEGIEKKVDNPISKVKKQELRLEEYLRKEGFIIDVKSIVYYANNDVSFNVKYDVNNVSIFNEDTANDLVNYINSYKGKMDVDFEGVLDIIIKVSK